MAVLSKNLLRAAMALGAGSVALAAIYFLWDAPYAAGFELSVGAGLVTVLFVFAICIAGEDIREMRSIVPKWFAAGIVLMLILLLTLFLAPIDAEPPLSVEHPLAAVVWQQRSLDTLVQVGLIFAGVLGLLGLLAEEKAPLEYPVADEVAAKRERELDELSQQSLEREAV